MEELQLKDYKIYLKLLNQFRDIQEMSFDEFEKIYNIVNKTTNIYVYKENDTIIGCISLIIEQKFINNNGRVCHIEDLVIHKEHRKKGIGSAMLRFAKKEAKKVCCYKVILNCDVAFVDFYEKNDFNIYSNGMKYIT
jgi:glucosamine-phosphate N-acetyltransferase